ncbi:MAG: bifunctional UDP-N-acetylglucosamine diphosphorylase/glucosamine-1-phosphate N-acetyltransferase GlmU [Alphaproteobacteria bacterium]|nr:bifunctional UDP-N-acetylglucosamine diphosphorylase/glucosamine-1-phosphate N-acetyltransferase GlmU [Alphaproteobacteria bacterium]
MSENKLVAVVLAAGQGTRMKSSLPKVLHKVAGRPMINHLLATVDSLNADKAVVVISEGMKDSVAKAVAPHSVAVQHEQLGTGDAVKAALPEFEDVRGDVLVLYGDTPLIGKETLERMLKARRNGADVVVLGFTPDDPKRYGRLIMDDKGELKEIVEFKEATEEQKAVRLCNSGILCFDAQKLCGWLKKLKKQPGSGEYYLTETISLARADGCRAVAVEGNEEEMLGINSREELATMEKIVQRRLRTKFLDQGVTMTDPETVYFSFDTVLGKDVTIEPNVIFETGCVVEDNVEIKGFCHFEGTHIRKNAKVGPFARLRPGADIGEDCHIGDFVEIKNATIETGAKVNHLSYIGDARVGSKTNIGAGTITCNYDGFFKSKTDIGAGAFIGSDTVIVAPCTIGDGAMTAAGSVITKDVAANAMAVARGKQTALDGWAEKFRAQKKAQKEQAKK